MLMYGKEASNRKQEIDRQSKTPKYYRSTLTLTEKGVTVSRKISEKINGVLDEISGELTEEERVEFYRSLTIISNSLDAVARR